MEDSLSAEDSCQDVLQNLRKTNLIFVVQETAYSAYITVRKRFRKETFQKVWSSPIKSSINRDCEALKSLKIAHDKLINCYDDLKHKFEETVTECEELHTKVAENEVIVANLHEKLREAETEMHNKSNLKGRNQKLEAENKALKNEKDEIVKENKAANVALKSSKKELKDSTYRFNKKVAELETNIEELTRFKVVKNSEEKEIRNKQKKIEKKLKLVREREAQLKLDQSSLEKQQKHLTNDKKITDDNENLIGDIKEHLEITVKQVSDNLPNPNVKGSKPSPSLTTPTLVPHYQPLDPAQDHHCEHDPQCVLRAPHPPPHGPLTLKQHELQLLVMDCTTMDLVSSTRADPTRADSGNQDERSLGQSELLKLLEAFSERTENKFDDFGQKFMNSI